MYTRFHSFNTHSPLSESPLPKPSQNKHILQATYTAHPPPPNPIFSRPTSHLQTSASISSHPFPYHTHPFPSYPLEEATTNYLSPKSVHSGSHMYMSPLYTSKLPVFLDVLGRGEWYASRASRSLVGRGGGLGWVTGDNSVPSGGGGQLLGRDIGSLLKLPLGMEGQGVR